MLSMGTVIFGIHDAKTAITRQEVNQILCRCEVKDLFELAWEAYSKEWDHGYAWLNLHTGEIEGGHEKEIDQRFAYIILLTISEADFVFNWGHEDELAEYEKEGNGLSLRQWCKIKGIDYRERIKQGVLLDWHGWSQGRVYSNSSLHEALNTWYQSREIPNRLITERMKEAWNK